MSAVTSAGKELIDFQAKNYKSLEKWNKFEAGLVTQADLKSDEIIKNINLSTFENRKSILCSIL